MLRTVVPIALLALCTACGHGNAETPPQAAPPSTTLVPLHAPLATPPAAQSLADAELTDLANVALTPDDTAAHAAVEELRRRGQAGLDALLAVDDGSERASLAIDTVAKQRDARASRLYWHTDLEEAKRAATASGGRPILSLRLLGRLDQDLSCANSRFFRTALYPNTEVSAYLRATYVLHWSSERPAPKITVDYGDGHRIERTITGNSIHYVLDAQARLVDAIPGLYGPKAFLGALQNAAPVAMSTATAPEASRRGALLAFHEQRRATIAQAWTADLAFLGVTAAPLPQPLQAVQPSAAVAVPIAMPKAVVEGPMVAALLPASATTQELERMTTDKLWLGIASRRASESVLDASSRALIKRKSGADSATLARQLTGFQQLMALDTVKNEYMLHRKIHEWMLAGAIEQDMATLNARVYTELFLTPRSDPWLGLVTPGVYTGIDNEGLFTP